jgi:hypothetical protein
MSKEGKHHSIPVFYLRRWTGRDGKLCELSRPYRPVKPRRVHPDGTAYVHGLNTVQGFPPESAQYVETELLQKLDDRAANALARIIAEPQEVDNLKLEIKAIWAQFLVSLVARSPEILAKMQARLNSREESLLKKRSTSTAIYEHRVPLHAAEILPSLVSSKLPVLGLVNMIWAVRSTSRAAYAMLTSDRPVIMSNGLADPNAHMAIPVTPRLLFVAAKRPEFMNYIISFPADQLTELVNNKVCEQAIRFVYGEDDRQLRFIEKRLGKRVQSSPLG